MEEKWRRKRNKKKRSIRSGMKKGNEKDGKLKRA